MPRHKGASDEERQAFRDQAPADTVSYLQESQHLIQSQECAEERRLAIGNVFEGLEGLEKLAVDATCTRILEGMAAEASGEAAGKLLGRLNEGDLLFEIAAKYVDLFFKGIKPLTWFRNVRCHQHGHR